MTRCTTQPSGTERENWHLLVITASVGQLNLGCSGNNHERSTTDPPEGKHILEPMDGFHFLWIYQGNQLWRCHCEGVE